MIAVDTSVIIAIAADEPEAEVFRPLIGREPIINGWPTLLEARMVLTERFCQLGEDDQRACGNA
jgi:ribonuclease VapC